MDGNIFKRKRSPIIVLAACCVMGYIFFSKQSPVKPQYGPLPVEDLSQHPVYKNYAFSASDKVLDFGIQPLWVPANIILEVMKRDSILLEELGRLGYEIRFHSFYKGADVNFFLLRGDLEGGIGGDMPALTAAALGAVFIPILAQHGFTAIVAKRPGLLTQLKGARVAYAPGSNAHFSLVRSLADQGLGVSDAVLVPMDVNRMLRAFEKGEIDAFSAWEPTPFLAVLNNQDNEIIHRSLSTGYMYFSPLLKTSNPEAIRQLMASEIRALKWMQAEPANVETAAGWALAAMERFLGHPAGLTIPNLVKLAVNDLIGIESYPAIPEKYLNAEGVLRHEFEFLKAQGMMDTSKQWSSVVGSFNRSEITNIINKKTKYNLNHTRYNRNESADD